MSGLSQIIGRLRAADASRKSARFEWLILVLSFWFSGESRALAYLDPGTGNVLLQAALSVFVGVLFWARHSIRRMGDLFRRSNRRSPHDGNRDIQV